MSQGASTTLPDCSERPTGTPKAEPLLRQALAIAEKRFRLDHPNVATASNNLTSLIRDTNRHPKADAM
jgi:hypothetical protein